MTQSIFWPAWDPEIIASELMIILIFPNDARSHASVSVDLVHWPLLNSGGNIRAICLVHFLSKEACETIKRVNYP